MKALPCPQCGKPATNSTFCLSCLRELHPLVQTVKEANITLCVKSGEVKIRHAWEKIPMQEGIERVMKKALIPPNEASISQIEIAPVDLGDYVDKPGVEKELSVHVQVTGKASAQIRKEYTEEYYVPLLLKTTISPKYAKIGTDYFEGTMQLRNEREEHTTFMKKEAKKHDGLAINKESDRPTGHDYFFTKKNPMKIIGYDMQKRFAGFVKENARLVTHDKLRSKDVHRLTLFIEFPPFTKGDVVLHKERIYLIRGFAKKVQCKDIMRGKNTEIEYKGNKNREFEVLHKQEMKVSQTHPHLAIIDPKTFQQVRVHTIKEEEFTIGQMITLVEFQKKWWKV